MRWLLFLVLAALSTLAFPLALKTLIDQGLVSADGAPAARFSGIFKLGRPWGSADDTDPLGIRTPA